MHLREGIIILRFLKFCLSMKSQNKEDIFTLEKVKGPLFFFVQEENIVYKYNANILVALETKASRTSIACSKMTKPTQQRSHSIAQSVTRASQNQGT